jgi:hypothetical protein
LILRSDLPKPVYNAQLFDVDGNLIAHGILTLHFPPKRIRTDAPGVITQIPQAIENGRRRPPLATQGLPSAD